jgi:lipopolysaccharide biosynthesis regulator YciM
LGAAFLTVARRDSSGASRQFAQLADSVGSAAPALLAMAARLAPGGTALVVWEQVITAHPRSPEAPEALLALARLHRDRRDQDRAITRLEQLLIEYPTSALAPQARRELDRLKGQVPPAGR